MGVVIPFGGSADAPLPSLDALVGLVADDMGRVNDGILARAQSHVELIPDLARHLINSGGKRLRPMLTLAAAQAGGYAGERPIGWPRRSNSSIPPPCCMTTWWTKAPCAAARFRQPHLGQQAERAGGRLPALPGLPADGGDRQAGVLDILAGASAVIAEGEVMQLKSPEQPAVTEDAYLRVVAAKTAALFAAAAEAARCWPAGEDAGGACVPMAKILASPSSWWTMRWIIPAQA